LKSLSERVGSDLKTTLKSKDEFLDRLKIDLKIQIQSRDMSDPTLSDIDFKDKMAWVWSPDSGLRLKIEFLLRLEKCRTGRNQINPSSIHVNFVFFSIMIQMAKLN